MYDRGDQKVSTTAKIFLFMCNMATSAVGTLAFFDIMEWLDFIYVCSYIKLAVTLKYLPQVEDDTQGISTHVGEIFVVF